MWELLKREPKIVYHYTKRENASKIIEDRSIKKFKDVYAFVCESYEDCIDVIKNTMLNPDARFIDFDGIPKKYSKVDIDEYVVIKAEVKYSKMMCWYKSKSSNNEEVDGVTLAYKGNIPVRVMEVRNIEL